ncbi:hypothetical protein CB0940_06719 [Cercospora beticola]|uniref:F-box domain-containing protein n=1 Tax=Cercospora beticola TaxID=122368 RepID=A0A2G5H9A4_CERBT|nr:hypothetical protein CB0940_06719 [Cercospora beticola]PIA89101.1 hypothetical protein CB0940_06719 [Cercospora beticola]WPB02619.1 hypothetical protein RHO25_007255 [Cercospora beticola]
MANSKDDSHTLRERLDELPPELWEMIYDLTFTADAKVRLYSQLPERKDSERLTSAKLHELAQGYSKEIVTVNEIPYLLHVDRASRNKFARSFYGNPDSLFIVSRCSNPGVITHLKLVKNIHMGIDRWGGGIVDRYCRRAVVEWTGKSEHSICFLYPEDIEALLKKRAGIANSASAGL